MLSVTDPDATLTFTYLCPCQLPKDREPSEWLSAVRPAA
jgi:hypothetical protein